jgi:hypothetical protein
VERVVALAGDAPWGPFADRERTFYRELDRSSVVPRIHQVERSGATHFVELGPLGIEEGVLAPTGERRFVTRHRLSHLYFVGPLTHGLSLDIRRALRDRVRAALPADSRVASDAFPLFDYDAIPRRSWQWPDEDAHVDGGAGEFLELRDGGVLRGGWRGKDGGASYRSFEVVWHELQRREARADHEVEILTLLEAARLDG